MFLFHIYLALGVGIKFLARYILNIKFVNKPLICDLFLKKQQICFLVYWGSTEENPTKMKKIAEIMRYYAKIIRYYAIMRCFLNLQNQFQKNHGARIRQILAHQKSVHTGGRERVRGSRNARGRTQTQAPGGFPERASWLAIPELQPRPSKGSQGNMIPRPSAAEIRLPPSCQNSKDSQEVEALYLWGRHIR